MPSDPSRLIAPLARDPINLDLKTLDLCFLAGLYLRADRASLASFEEDVLIDMFEQVCDVVPRCQDRCRAPPGELFVRVGHHRQRGANRRGLRERRVHRCTGHRAGSSCCRGQRLAVWRIVGAAEHATQTAKDKT